ncbi:hypothetical protein Tco_0009514 [Tanacetum coccineum]
MVDAKLACRVSMSFPTNLICSSGSGTTDGNTYGSSDGEGDLDLLRDEDGKSYDDGEDDDGKSDSGGEDDDGIFDVALLYPSAGDPLLLRRWQRQG